jgi:hypothetical protein
MKFGAQVTTLIGFMTHKRKKISPRLRMEGAGNDLSDLKSERCRTLQPIAIKDPHAVLANCEQW